MKAVAVWPEGKELRDDPSGRITRQEYLSELTAMAINPAEMFDFVAQDVTGDYYIFRSHKSKASSAGKSSTTRPKPVARPRTKVHRVKAGENLSVIAAKRGTTVSKLCKLNGITRKTILRPGQILKYS